MVVWIIGLSGSGKTTLAEKVVEEIRTSKNNVVLIDGDVIRKVFGDDLTYTFKDRQKNAERICQLCKFFDDQGVHVVCAILSIFPASRLWNRNNIKNYYEVFIDAPLKQLQKRDYKGLYRKYNEGKIKNVAGMDIEFIPPNNPDLIINNNGSKNNLLEHAKLLSKLLENSNP